ncbi:MAG: mutarotase [Algibacter sp.]
MNLKTHYDNLYKDAIQKIQNNEYLIDTAIHSPQDNRYGITLLIRPPEVIKNEIQKFLNQLNAIEPNQYYYRNSDIHITVMSIISCYDEFELKDIRLEEYIKIIEDSFIKPPNIEIEFRGVSASPSCVMIQGFLSNNSLNIIRDRLRENFKLSNLQQSIDKRYSIQTAHSTVVRFTEKLNKKAKFLNAIESFRNHKFGIFKPENLELVYNDWYQKKERVKSLYKFNI